MKTNSRSRGSRRAAFALALMLLGCRQSAGTALTDGGASHATNGVQASPASTVQNASPAAATSAAPAARLEPQLRQAGELAYLELVTGGASDKDQLPLIVALHGLGDKPERFVGFVQHFDVPARIVLPRGTDSYGDGYSWFWLADKRDVARISRGVSAATERLAKSIAEIARQRPTRGKPIVTGFSQGGMLSFSLALLHPELIAASYPMAGVVPPPLIDKLPRGAAYPPIFALHGEADPVIRLADTKKSVLSLKQRGIDVTLKTYPGVQHTPSFEMGFELFQQLRAACRAAGS